MVASRTSVISIWGALISTRADAAALEADAMVTPRKHRRHKHRDRLPGCVGLPRSVGG